MGKARAVGLLTIIVVVLVVGLSFFEPTPAVELLQNKQVILWVYMHTHTRAIQIYVDKCITHVP